MTAVLVAEVALRVYVLNAVRTADRATRRSSAGSGCGRTFVPDDTLGWRLAPNCTTGAAEPRGREYAVTVRANNHGFRDDKNYDLARHEGVQRIVVLGDSFTYGNGVEEAQRYSNLLDELLGPGVEVYNLGISNYGLDQALMTLQSQGLRYDPDVILLGVSEPMIERLTRRAGDVWWTRPYFELHDGRLRPAQQPGGDVLTPAALFQTSFLLRLIDAGATRWNRDGGDASHTLGRNIVERIAELSRESGSSLAVVTINPKYALDRPGLPTLNRWLAESAAREGFHFLDLYPVVTNLDYASLFYPIDGHYTRAGHLVVAESLCRFLRSRRPLADIADTPCTVQIGLDGSNDAVATPGGPAIAGRPGTRRTG